MCGLIGHASTEGTKAKWADRKDMFTNGLYHSAVRGDDSTGIAWVKAGNEKKLAQVYKKAMSPADFVQLGNYAKIMNDFDSAVIMMGHTRAATAVKVNNENAHPFQHGAITLTHNGHIQNANALLRGDPVRGSHVDSSILCQAMAKYGELEVLEAAEGPFALAWHNAERGTLNFARNGGREIRFCFLEDQNSMFWASERLMLVWLAEHHKIAVEGLYKTLDPGQWVEFDLTNLRGFKARSFDQRSRYPGTGERNNCTLHPAHRSATAAAQTTTSPENLTTTGNSTKTDSDGTGGVKRPAWNNNQTLIETVLARLKVDPDTLIARKKEFTKSSGRPTKNKRIHFVKNMLKKFGVIYDSYALGYITNWEPYKQQPENGLARVALSNSMAIGEIQNLKKADHQSLSKFPYFLMRVVGYRLDKVTGIPIFTMERHEMYPEYATEKERLKKLQRLVSSQEAEAPITQKLFLGPGSRMIPISRYLELTRNGCGACSGDISTHDERNLLWLGQDPICEKCSNSEQIMLMVGAPNHMLPKARLN